MREPRTAVPQTRSLEREPLGDWGFFWTLMSVVLLPVAAIVTPFLLSARRDPTPATATLAGLYTLTLISCALALGAWFDPNRDRPAAENAAEPRPSQAG